ncbi:YciI family protein [Nocardioides KLBMP 9356]|uniref:YciI family protein n=1 Tax=Nocardioides potassii TaxID=2911371 RepID=A0ABS9H8H7_9ACTN|nr:YciI family protein [Nocardioides potassii]MCF6377515.1 YciI family protein [Nocardioides potassii]
MTEYVVLLLGDAERWWDLSDDERREGYAAHEAFSAQLVERGHTITGGAELHRASEARTIAPHATEVTEGPWAETAEQVGGFYLVESSDLDDLLDCCRVLTATGDAVEVRRCVDPGERAS